MKRILFLATLAGVLVVTAVPAPAATRSVALGDNFFRPSSLTVRKGDVVRFVWRGDAFHNVKVSRGPQRFGSRTKSRGSYRKRLTRRGSYRLVCTLHFEMRMRLRVR